MGHSILRKEDVTAEYRYEVPTACSKVKYTGTRRNDAKQNRPRTSATTKWAHTHSVAEWGLTRLILG